MDTSTHIHKTRKWLLAIAIVSFILALCSLFITPIPLAFIATVAGIAFALIYIVKLIAFYLHRYSTQSHTPAWRPGDKT